MGRRFEKGDRVRALTELVGDAAHPRGVKIGDIGIVRQYYGTATLSVQVDFPGGFIGSFNELHLEPADN